MGSIRLPGKSMMTLAGKPLIYRVLERIKKVKRADKVILAIPCTKENDILQEQSEEVGVDVYRGSEDDLLDRYYKAAKKWGADIIGRIPADNPLSEAEEIDRIIQHHKSLNKIGFSSNLAEVKKSKYPDGIGAEMFDFCLLEKAWKNETNKQKREHVHLNFYDYESDRELMAPECYVSTIECPKEIRRPDLVLDVNTKKQYLFIKEIYDYFYKKNPNFGVRDVIGWYDNIYKKGKRNE
tara:strand:+ start:1463 stop:2176 length:714 start_codon:yes stop_codon:yes gene_type:complete